MGRDYIFPYCLTIAADKGHYEPFGWAPRARRGRPGDGAPTDANLAKWVADFEASTRPGGANAHLGATTVRHAVITKGTTWGPVVARYRRG